ncbi:MAG: radical SAM protein [Polyangiaceae bacterium]|nr:radical SAM protein [Polyangiaceae bacterium]
MNVRTPPASSPPAPGAAGDAAKVEAHESAAHEKRNWVRLTYDCNNHCSFCLDTLAHDGTLRSNLDIKVQIVEGRKKGATRLILSGGEPTMHPNFLDFVLLGRRAGYRRIQTVTNGRMFAYPEFLQRAAENGLHEITFSIHGPNAKIHDALVGVAGAFEEETAGLHAALASGRFIVNIDIVINKQNVAHLSEMLELFLSWGVREFDLLHIIPFGNAWGPARESLFYDLEQNAEHLRRAFAYSLRPDVHVWLNRFPPEYTEGFEALIQDPYKLNDEIRGRREEFDRYLAVGQKLQCREPERCRYCYLEQLCDGLDRALEERRLAEVDVLRLAEPLSIAGTLPAARFLRVVARSLTDVPRFVARAPGAESLWLELADWAGAEAALRTGVVAGKPVARVYAETAADARRLLALAGTFEVAVWANRDTASTIAELARESSRLVVAQRNYDKVTEQLTRDVDLATLCAALPPSVGTENIPACLGGRPPERSLRVLDAAMLGPDARLDVGKYGERYVAERFRTKSRRCGECVHEAGCDGVHINFVRAHGYAALRPIAP